MTSVHILKAIRFSISRRFIYERSVTNIRNWWLAYSFTYLFYAQHYIWSVFIYLFGSFHLLHSHWIHLRQFWTRPTRHCLNLCGFPSYCSVLWQGLAARCPFARAREQPVYQDGRLEDQRPAIFCRHRWLVPLLAVASAASIACKGLRLDLYSLFAVAAAVHCSLLLMKQCRCFCHRRRRCCCCNFSWGRSMAAADGRQHFYWMLYFCLQLRKQLACAGSNRQGRESRFAVFWGGTSNFVRLRRVCQIRLRYLGSRWLLR